MTAPSTETRSRGFLAPVVGGLILIGALIAGVYFRSDVGRGIKWAGSKTNYFLTDWAPHHPAQTFAIGVFAAIALLMNWFSHASGRLRAWVFAIVVEAGLWLLFWYGLIIPPINKLLGLNIARPSFSGVLLSGALVIALTGAVFWLLEAREEWRKYRHRTSVDND